MYLIISLAEQDRRKATTAFFFPNVLDLCWAEVKTGESGFSNNQVAAMSKINCLWLSFTSRTFMERQKILR